MSISPLHIFVFNSLEDEWKFSQSIGSSYLLADSYLYMNSDYSNDVVITPIPVSTLFKTYVDSLVGIKSIVYSPVHKTHSICKNIISDKQVFASLIKEAKKRNNTIVLKAYVSTVELLLLRDAFKKKGVKVLLPENTEREHLWTIDFFGSKAGFRSMFSSFMPKGSICYSISEAIQKAQELYKSKKAIVIKTNKGNSGEGVVIIKNMINPDFKALFSAASYWKDNPIVIEEFIDTIKEKLSRFPSIEGFITPEGKVRLPYYCNMIVTKEGEFYGIEMHKDVVIKKVRKEMNKMTIHIGKTYANAGYRGRFDVDYLYDGKILYANESNTRTNGGTDTYFVSRKLIGSSFFSSRYVLSNYLELNKKTTFHAIQRLLASLLYDRKKRIGFILGSENALHHKGLSYILIGNNKPHTLSLVKKINILLKSILTIKKNKQ
jgi:hypothetical protein